MSTASSAAFLGRDIRQYHVLALIGKGGMGEVYKAEDRRLGRMVALKLLPRGFMGSADRLDRFEREARAASAINHPHIATVYEVGDVDGMPFIALEYVDGPDLFTWLSRHELSLVEVLRTMEQLAEALASAHSVGVLHRDLKPANVLVSESHGVKLVDFGLAKIAADKLPTDSDIRYQITTIPGAVMGTRAYMSPEQARGQRSDRRSDVFSYGVLLFEAIAGVPPFKGDSGIEAVSGVLREDPVPTLRERPGVPRELVRVVSRALEKDPGQRYQCLDDLLVDLRTVRRGLETGSGLPADEAEVPGRYWLGMAGALAAGVLAGWLVLGRLTQRVELLPPLARAGLQLRPITFPGSLNRHPTLSPAGDLLAYASDRGGSFDIVVEQLAGAGRPLRVTDDAGDEFEPQFSPDAQSLVFATGAGRIQVVPTLGGAVRTLADGDADGPIWSPDGKTVAYRSRQALFQVDRSGGTPRRLTAPGSPPVLGRGAWSPSGSFIVFPSSREGERVLARVPVQGGPVEAIGDAARAFVAPAWSEGWIFAGTRSWHDEGQEVWALPVTGAGVLSGDPTRVLAGASSFGRPALSGDQRRLAFEVHRLETHLARIPLAGAAEVAKPERIRVQARIHEAEIAHAGDAIVMVGDRTGAPALWRVPAEGGTPEPMHTSPGADSHPSWSPDDRRIAVAHAEEGQLRIALLPAAGGPLVFVTDAGVRATHPAWSPDGSRIAFVAEAGSRTSLRVASATGAPERTLVELAAHAGKLSWSPNGRLLAAALQEADGSWGVAVVSEAGGPPRPVVPDARAPLWLADGRLVFVREGHAGSFDLWSVQLAGDGTPVAGSTRRLTRLPRGTSVENEHGASTDGRSLSFPLMVLASQEVWMGQAP